ncbi:3-hydroxyisobutyrate dehydrogenase [Pseudomonas sp. JAI111]|uniref:NAD(P)-dependent oxidoreductase n=1 Tax=Pseudomonas sp. JAI111 TaxID=2735913 RepID=UPI0021689BC8|nr:NAD(P)-dependent oxidoreductase [Pseudomonas sp. JAI111]MCS3835700.1 3-hydroxyisobutyrate dehydrogenase [Pseudomonas sp. JAI111]
MSKPSVGFIGLGRMGGPMADNLIAKGFRTNVYDVVDNAVASRVDAGAIRHATPASLASASDVVFTCLPGPKESQQVMTAADGVLAGLRPGALIVECTTGSPEFVRELGTQVQAQGGHLVEACVSGGPQNSVAGTLLLMLGGDEAAIAKARPALEAVGNRLYHIGPLGFGTVAKLIHNMVFNVSIQVAVEGMVLALKSGIASETMLNILTEGAYGQGAITRWILPRMVDGAALGQQHFPISLSYKDLSIATEHARAVGASAPFAAMAEQNFLEALARDLGQCDNRELAAMLAARSGIADGLLDKNRLVQQEGQP